jgi:CubicO group peptidase (beta-lactamase class C family)
MNATKHAFTIGFLLAIALMPCATASENFQWTADDSTQLAETIQSGVYGTVTSVLILHNGTPTFEHYSNGASDATLHNTRSVTKTITGMAVGHAIDHGLLSLDESLASRFSDIAPFDNPDVRKLDITTEDLLTMSGPLECDDSNRFSRGNEERMYIVEDWSSFFWDLPIRGFPSWAHSPDDSPFGRAFSYCTAGVQILGEVVERASKIPFSRYVEENLFAPLGIKAFRWARNGNGKVHMGGGLELTTRGLATLAELQRNDGKYRGQTILSSAWTAASVEPSATVPDADWDYGYLWWLRSYSVDNATYRGAAMNGNGGNRVMVFANFDVTVVITKTDFNSSDMHARTDSFFEKEILPHFSAHAVD